MKFVLAIEDYGGEIKKTLIANINVRIAIFTVLKLKSDPGSNGYNASSSSFVIVIQSLRQQFV